MSRLYVVMYHYTRDLANSRYPQIKGLDAELFKQQIAFMKDNFTFVTMEEVIEAWNGDNTHLPENALLLTFDDGYSDNYLTAFPILKENRIQGSFFITAKTFTENKVLDVNKIHFILANSNIADIKKELDIQLDAQKEKNPKILSKEELYEKYAIQGKMDDKDTIYIKRVLQTALPEKIRNEITKELFLKYVGVEENIFARELYMSREQIRLMKNEGMYIGLHGYEHQRLGEMSEQDMQTEVDKSLEIMDEFIEKDNWVMNYPYGSYDENVINYVSTKGCKLGLTTNVAVASTSVHHKYEIPRLNCNDFPPKSKNYCLVE